jgi:uncharacterized protein with GYD domain
MTIYVALFNLTEAGIKAAKDSPRRLDAAKKLLADMGGEMKLFYMVMGEFDFVGICEAPDDAVMARYVLQLGSLGFVRTKTLKAFPETAYREIIRPLGSASFSTAAPPRPAAIPAPGAAHQNRGPGLIRSGGRWSRGPLTRQQMRSRKLLAYSTARSP